MDKLPDTNICTECGQEYERGIMQHVKHLEACTHDAPNESIDWHKIQLEHEKWKKKEAEQQKWFDKNIFVKMTNEEQVELCCRAFMGIIQRRETGETVVLMSSFALKYYRNFKEEMIKKYSK